MFQGLCDQRVYGGVFVGQVFYRLPGRGGVVAQGDKRIDGIILGLREGVWGGLSFKLHIRYFFM